MTCTPINLGNGVTGYTCSRRTPRALCVICKWREHTLLCDYALHGAKAGATCSAKLCSACAVRLGALDLCPAHARRANEQASLDLETKPPLNGTR